MKIENYSKQWYSITNRASLPNQIMIYGDIGDMGLNSADFVQDLRGQSGDLEIHINTQGGIVSDGIAIHNALKRHPGRKTVIVDAMAASIGSVIAMAGDEVLMSPGSQMMIHEGQGIAAGDAQEMRKFAELLDKNSDIIAGFYEAKTGTPSSSWRQMMKNETWFNASEAINAGLADGMASKSGITNKATDPDQDGDDDESEDLGQGWFRDPDGSYRFDPDNDGDNDASPDTDTDNGWWSPDGRLLKPIPPTPSAHSGSVIKNVKKPHGDLPYADPGYLDADGEQASKSGKEGVARYPIDADHVQAAWSYINQEKNASQYTPEQLASIKLKIKSAMKKFGHEVSENFLAQKISDALKGILIG